MNSRVNRLAKPRASRTPPAAFRPVAVSSVEVDVDVDVAEVIEVSEQLPRFASIPDATPNAFRPHVAEPFGGLDSDFDEAFEVTHHHKGSRDNSFDATIRRPDRSKKAKQMERARANRLFDAPFAHQVATTPPATFAARPVAPLARARQTVPPPAPSSTGATLVPVSMSADESGHYVANVGGPTVLVRRASLTNETARNVPGWLYAGVAAAVVLAGSLFAIGGRGTSLQAAGGVRMDAPVENVQYAPVAQPVQVQAPVVAVPVKPAAVDPVLAAALAAPVNAPLAPMPVTDVSPSKPAAPVVNAQSTEKPAPRVASSRVVVPPQPIVHAPRPMATPAPVAIKEPVEGGHDVRTSQQTSAAASKVIGDSL